MPRAVRPLPVVGGEQPDDVIRWRKSGRKRPSVVPNADELTPNSHESNAGLDRSDVIIPVGSERSAELVECFRDAGFELGEFEARSLLGDAPE